MRRYAALFPLVAISVSPFLLHQYHAYRAFCRNPTTHVSTAKPEWCDRTIPFIYSYVQAKYWDVGFLRYWTVAQIPNFLLAAPLLILLAYASTSHIISDGRIIFDAQVSVRQISSSSPKPITKASSNPPPSNPSPLRTLQTLPYALHTLALTLILLFASHTQIVLRLASSLPLTHWAVAELFVERPKVARIWITWNVVWWGVSCVLWAVFLPPA